MDAVEQKPNAQKEDCHADKKQQRALASVFSNFVFVLCLDEDNQSFGILPAEAALPANFFDNVFAIGTLAQFLDDKSGEILVHCSNAPQWF
jgi:hypothetical protein